MSSKKMNQETSISAATAERQRRGTDNSVHSEMFDTREDDDLETMQELFGTNFIELATLYLTDTPKRTDALHEAARCGDSARMASTAHALTGSCASIGANRLAMLCRDLETQCKAGVTGNFELRLVAIEAEYARIELKLRSLMHSGTV